MTRPIRIPGIPDQAAPLFADLQQEDLLPVSTLRAAVEAYRQAIARHAQGGPADPELGDRIASALDSLLGRVNHLTDEPAYRAVQAAVRYFLIQEDGGGSDLASHDGLHDDARVVNAVVRYFGRDDLTVAVPEVPPPQPAAPSTARRQFAMPPPRR
jgi:hypothetical protein